MRLISPFLLVLLFLVMVSGCGYDENKGIFMAPGSYSDLAVVTSSDALAPLAHRFLETFNTTKTFVIKEEPTFLVDVFPTARWDLAKGYKNSLILVRIGDGGPVEKMVRKSLPSETWDRLKSGAGGVVKLNDPWASYQLAVVVASRDRNNLGSLLTKNRTKIQEIFAESSRERILRRNRFEGLNLPLMEDHWQRFGFFMEVPREFERIQFLPDGYQGIEMMKKGPSRGLTVTWRPSEDPVGELADIDALAAMRTELGESDASGGNAPGNIPLVRGHPGSSGVHAPGRCLDEPQICRGWGLLVLFYPRPRSAAPVLSGFAGVRPGHGQDEFLPAS